MRLLKSAVVRLKSTAARKRLSLQLRNRRLTKSTLSVSKKNNVLMSFVRSSSRRKFGKLKKRMNNIIALQKNAVWQKKPVLKPNFSNSLERQSLQLKSGRRGISINRPITKPRSANARASRQTLSGSTFRKRRKLATRRSVAARSA